MSYISQLIENKPEFEIELYEYLLTLKPVAQGGTINSLAISPISEKASKLIIATEHNSLLKALAKNSNLSVEIADALNKLGHPAKGKPQENSTMSMQLDPTSSLFPYIESPEWKNQSIAGVRGLEVALPHIAQQLYEIGHPYSIFDKAAPLSQADISEESIRWIIEREYLHRIFWRELTLNCEGFAPAFRIQEETAILFVTHEAIAPEFNYMEFESDMKIGGSINSYPEREWLKTTLTVPDEDYPEETEYLIEIDVEFPENLSWQTLQQEKKEQLLSLLITGMESTDPDLSADSEHFLACMALHPGTGQILRDRLKSIDSSLISDVLDAQK